MKLTKHIALTAALGLGISLAAQAASHSTTTFIGEEDINGDGLVSLAEFKQGRQLEFTRTDFNADGALSEAEYVGDYEGRLMLKLAKIADPDKRREEQQRQMRQAKVRFGVLDSDKNGAISAEEFMASGLRMFTLHDRDKNDRVDAKDIELAEAERKQGKTGFVAS